MDWLNEGFKNVFQFIEEKIHNSVFPGDAFSVSDRIGADEFKTEQEELKQRDTFAQAWKTARLY